eukprot:CAMPEP_0196684222 /NCGR_PEP_ID=MMETSP1090-20130531/10410_1 /TAXON_ID=37098 /ORGANISM="Isochrysis sp, Strain CCMP1244" /LENGTH=294 /DNA_ID=CAMNT_0042022695 /DNA_START=36 /DNA_END=922 /DNA_ORIENTATION=+
MAEEPQEPAADEEAADAEPAQAPIVAELTEEQKKFLVACATGNRVQIELYVNEKSLDPNLQSGTEGLRPLHLTCGAGATDCARLLVEKGAEIAVTDQMGLTPLHWAAGCRDPEVTRYLLSAGAKSIIDQRDEDGVTALIHASYANRAETVQILLDEGADVDVEDNSGNTAKKWAVEKKRGSVLRVFDPPLAEVATPGDEESDRGLDTFAMCTWLSQPQALLALAAMAWAAERRPEIFLYIARNAVTGNLSFSGSEFLSIDTSCVPRAPALAGQGLGLGLRRMAIFVAAIFGGRL